VGDSAHIFVAKLLESGDIRGVGGGMRRQKKRYRKEDLREIDKLERKTK